MKSSATSSARLTGSDSPPAPARVRRAVRRPQLSEEVAADLRYQIMTAEVRPGDFIRLDETAERLGVSVTPVREALLTLRGEGMVSLAPHRGYIVSQLDRVDIEDLFWLQGEIAVKLATRVAASVTPDQLAELEWWNHQLRAAVARADVAAIADAEFEFHRLHNHIAGSRKLAWFLFAATRYTPAPLYATDPAWGAVTVDCHDKLIAAYRDRDVEEVVRQTRRQFTDGAERLMAHLAATGIWD